MNKEIKLNGQKLETVTSFKHMGPVVFDEGSKPEILSRIPETTVAIWNDRSIPLSSKIRLVTSHVISIFLYACESLTLAAQFLNWLNV